MKYTIKKFSVVIILHLFLLTVAISCLYPLIWMLSSSLKSQETIFTDISLFPKKIHFQNYFQVISKSGFGRYFINSVFYTASTVFLLVILSSLAAFAFSRLKFPFRNFFFVLFILAMMIPIPASFVPLFVLLNRLGLRDTAIGYILCMTGVGLSLSIFLLKTYFDSIPKELEDSAYLDGCSKFDVYRFIFLPLSKPMIAVVIVFNTLNVWNEYILATLIFDNKNLMPIQRAIILFQGEFLTNYPLLMAGLTITSLPVILIYVLAQRYIKEVISNSFF